MKKIDVSKSLIFSRNLKDLKNSLDYLYQSGYCSNSEDFSLFEEGTLDGVHASNFMFRPFELTQNGDNQFFSYFTPKSEVVFVEEEPEKKKLRPFKNAREFCDTTDCKLVGSNCITIRDKNAKRENFLLYTGFSEDSIHLGGYVLTLKELFYNYEFLHKGEWIRFGVEE